MIDQPADPKIDPDQISVELSSRRTGMSFQRTRMSADRTLMSVIRTSLSLISFGFTIFQVFQKLRDQNVVTHAGSARNFGVALVALGILMLIGGIVYHGQFMVHLREERKAMKAAGLVHGEERLPGLTDADYRHRASLCWNCSHHQHAVPGWAVRLRRSHGEAFDEENEKESGKESREQEHGQESCGEKGRSQQAKGSKKKQKRVKH